MGKCVLSESLNLFVYIVQYMQPLMTRHLTTTTQACQKGTLGRQNELKKLPVPELQDTLTKWLLTTSPHLSPVEFERTKGKFIHLSMVFLVSQKLLVLNFY